MNVNYLKKLFTRIEGNEAQEKRHEQLREKALAFALLINELCPDSVEKGLAITKLQQSVMYANASISIHEGNENFTACDICR